MESAFALLHHTHISILWQTLFLEHPVTASPFPPFKYDPILHGGGQRGWPQVKNGSWPKAAREAIFLPTRYSLSQPPLHPGMVM